MFSSLLGFLESHNFQIFQASLVSDIGLLLSRNSIPSVTSPYTKLSTRIIVAPEGTSSNEDKAIPVILIKVPIKTEMSIIRGRLCVNLRLKEAGIVRRAITRIIPTTLMSTTIVRAIMQSNKR